MSTLEDIDAFFDSFGDCTDEDMARVAAAQRKYCRCGHQIGKHLVLGPCPRRKPNGRRCTCKRAVPKRPEAQA